MIQPLHELPPDVDAIVDHVEDLRTADPIAGRLRDLGFMPGELVRIVALGPFGGDPLVVRVGYTRFALRRAEAARIHVRGAVV